MKKYVEIFNQIKETSSRLEKERILKENKDVEGFQDILKFVYNPMIVTGLAKKKMEKEIKLPNYAALENIFDAMQYVSNNNTGTDTVVYSLQKFLNKLETQEERDLAVGILIKDMPYGISRTTLNKVYGSDFIPKYAVQLAGRYLPDANQFNGKFALTLKLDGNRCTIFNYENEVKAYARSGKEIEGLDELFEDFASLPKNMVYDGELIAKNTDNLESKDLFRVTQTIVRKKGQKTGLNFIVFDALPISEFQAGKSKKVYSERLEMMNNLFSFNKGYLNHVEQVPLYYIGDDKDVIPKYLEEVTSKGFEGLMINTMDGYYQTKRTKDLLKVKEFHTADLQCVGVKEDIRGGRCGSLTVDYKGHRVDVAGLTDKHKVEFWNNPELVVGKIIEVKYFEESENQLGGISLRFPSFIRIREDKTIEDISYA